MTKPQFPGNVRARGARLSSIHGWEVVVAVLLGVLVTEPAAASLTRNAAGARNMGEGGVLTLDNAVQVEEGPDGTVWTLEAAVQYQLSNRFQLLLEAVPFTWDVPDEGHRESGVGDTEVTVSLLALAEKGFLPPVVLAGRVKLPTASAGVLGTGKADFGGLLILGKEFGELELNFEMEFATFGSPEGQDLEDQFIYSVTAEYGLTGFLAVYGEAFGNSEPAAGESRTDGGLLGLELDTEIGDVAAPYLSVEIDTEDVTTVRGGVECSW